MTRVRKRLARWVDELIDELSSFAGTPASIAPTVAPVPPAPALPAPVSAGPSATDAIRLAPAPARKRAPRPPQDPATRRAEKTVGAAKQAVVGLFEDVRLGKAVSLEQVAPVVGQLQREVEQNATALLEVLRLKNKSEYTYLHSVAVSAMMIILGRAMGYRDDDLSSLGLAGLLHDIGKMGIPSRILDKPGRLTDTEFASVQAHPVLGRELLKQVPGLPEIALDVCLLHHEKIDGSGYPFGHAKEKISVAARMGAICDVYDALTSDRPYKEAWPTEKALGQMRDWPGHFDPAILAKFMQALGIYPEGSLVSVGGRSLAVVLGKNPKRPSYPIVRTFYSIDQKCRIRCEDVAIHRDGLLAIEDPSCWPFDDWPAMAHAIALRIP